MAKFLEVEVFRTQNGFIYLKVDDDFDVDRYLDNKGAKELIRDYYDECWGICWGDCNTDYGWNYAEETTETKAWNALDLTKDEKHGNVEKETKCEE